MLTLLPTPIGNLQDITLRSLEVLKRAEVLICEDMRVSKRLIHLLVQKELLSHKEYRYLSLHSHNSEQFLSQISADFFLQEVVYMSDAGMPCVSDPGAILVEYAQKHGIAYSVLPGANALLTLFVASGSTSSQFFFHGFLPHKSKERTNELYGLLAMRCDVILYESPHRLEALLCELKNLAPNREIFLAKELTKLHEKFYRGSAQVLQERLREDSYKGEWSILIYKDESAKEPILTLGELATLEIPPKIRAKILAKMSGRSIKECYRESCALAPKIKAQGIKII